MLLTTALTAIALTLTSGGYSAYTECPDTTSTNCYWDATTVGQPHSDSYILIGETPDSSSYFYIY